MGKTQVATNAKYLVLFIVEPFGKVTRFVIEILLMFNLTLSHCLLLYGLNRVLWHCPFSPISKQLVSFPLHKYLFMF